jgi:hypothetical protein
MTVSAASEPIRSRGRASTGCAEGRGGGQEPTTIEAIHHFGSSGHLAIRADLNETIIDARLDAAPRPLFPF